MLWASDLGMEPLLAVWSGLWLNGTSLTLEELQPYIQSALDEIEFLMKLLGTAHSKSNLSKSAMKTRYRKAENPTGRIALRLSTTPSPPNIPI
jgi:hypothetical protein